MVGGAAALADRWPADSGTNGPEMGLWLLGGAHVEVMHSSLVFANGSRTVLQREGVDGVQGHCGAVGVTAGASVSLVSCEVAHNSLGILMSAGGGSGGGGGGGDGGGGRVGGGRRWVQVQRSVFADNPGGALCHFEGGGAAAGERGERGRGTRADTSPMAMAGGAGSGAHAGPQVKNGGVSCCVWRVLLRVVNRKRRNVSCVWERCIIYRRITAAGRRSSAHTGNTRTHTRVMGCICAHVRVRHAASRIRTSAAHHSHHSPRLLLKRQR